MPEWKQEITSRLAGLKLEPTREAEIVEELSQHLDDRHAELLATGMSRAEAARTTLAELNNSELLVRELRRVEDRLAHQPSVLGGRRKNMAGDLIADLRFGARMLVKNPGFTNCRHQPAGGGRGHVREHPDHPGFCGSDGLLRTGSPGYADGSGSRVAE